LKRSGETGKGRSGEMGKMREEEFEMMSMGR